VGKPVLGRNQHIARHFWPAASESSWIETPAWAFRALDAAAEVLPSHEEEPADPRGGASFGRDVHME